VTVEVADGNGGAEIQAIAVTVMNVNEDPVITSAATSSVAENQTSVLTVTSTDVDGGTPGYSISGGADAALFSIDSGTGVLSFAAAPDFETATDAGTNNVYNVTVEVSDGNGGIDTQAIAVTVTDVNDDPVITSTSSVITAENQNAVLTVMIRRAIRLLVEPMRPRFQLIALQALCHSMQHLILKIPLMLIRTTSTI